MTTRFDVVNHISPGLSHQDIPRQQHQQPIGPYDLALGVDDTQPVSIPIKGNAKVRTLLSDLLDQCPHVFRITRVRVVIGEASIHLTVQVRHLAA